MTFADPGSATINITSNTTSDVWHTWCDATTDGSSTNGAPSGTVWGNWVTDSNSTSGSITYSGNQPIRETEEQRQARLEREARLKAEREAALREREAARRKAEELLRESLDEQQREQFDETKWFFVISQSGKRYRVRRGWAGNIDELNEADEIVASYCIHPRERVPVEDSMLIQKLMLEADESRFLEIANRTGFNAPRPLAV
jgi:hypothetical protein